MKFSLFKPGAANLKALTPTRLAIASGSFLFLSFPGFSLGFLAWGALLPLLFALRRAPSRGSAALLGLITGLVFFLISIHWMTHVTTFGWIFLGFLEAVFLVLFSLAVYEGRHLSGVLRAGWIALAWVSCEFLRAEIPVFGLGWNLLAYSQAPYPVILQAANAVGAYGLGAFIAFANGLLEEMLSSGRSPSVADEGKTKVLKRFLSPVVFLAVSIGLLLGHGFYHLRGVELSEARLRISVIQGNIPQDIKWAGEAREKILSIHSKLSELASFDGPELIVWPEASFPGYFNRDLERHRILEQVKRLGIPFLIGSPHLESPEQAFNSAYLINADGVLAKRYDKQYLVPFGEYVPLKLVFKWLEPLAYSLGVSDFSRGYEPTVFDLVNGEIRFSTLICFEDVFPNLARHFVERGADFLTVITNDAWFAKTAAPHQHLQASIFRAVENGVSVVRSANTGVSAFISPRGIVTARVENAKGEPLFVTGHRTEEVDVRPRPTLYRRGGWFFPYAASAVFVMILVVQKIRDRQKK